MAKAIALLTLPLYTRHVSTAGYGDVQLAADGGDPVRASCCASAWARRSSASTSTTTDEARRARIARTATATVAWTTTLASLLAVAFAGQLSRLILGYHDAGLIVLRDPRAVGVHEPRDGLRAAARGRARAHVHVRLGRERGDDGGVHDLARRVRRPGCARAAARQLRRLGDRRAGAVVGAARRGVAAREVRATCARCCTSGCRPCRRTRACTRCRSPTASTCCAASARTARPASTRSRCSSRRSCSWSCAASSTRGRRWRTRSTATPRPSRLYSLVTTYFVLATGVVVVRRGAARALDRAAARRARVLRRLHGAAVARARVDAVRAVSGDDRDHRPRAGHSAQPTGGRAPGWP